MLLQAGMGLATPLRDSVLAGMVLNQLSLRKGPVKPVIPLQLWVCVLDTEFKVILEDRIDYGSHWRH